MNYCGRDFTKNDIDTIKKMMVLNPGWHRKRLSQEVCSTFDWKKPDGGLKEMSCRVAMIRMDKDGLIQLPAPRCGNGNKKKYSRRTTLSEPKPPVHTPVHELTDLEIKLTTPSDSHLWNEFIDRYHYLGYKPLPGAQLRYFVKAKGQIMALLGFGAAAWMTAPRDEFIGWSHEQRKKKLHLIVNNARFLIPPWVFSRNLASKALSLVTKQLADDWEQRYKYRPVLVETFVENQKFIGTSYKCSNWINLGNTKGRGKLGPKAPSQPIKSVWVYPLTKKFKAQLYI